MPLLPVTCARAGSKLVVIDCATVPGAATGTADETVKDPPPLAEVIPTLDTDETERLIAEAGNCPVIIPIKDALIVSVKTRRACRLKNISQL